MTTTMEVATFPFSILICTDIGFVKFHIRWRVPLPSEKDFAPNSSGCVLTPYFMCTR